MTFIVFKFGQRRLIFKCDDRAKIERLLDLRTMNRDGSAHLDSPHAVDAPKGMRRTDQRVLLLDVAGMFEPQNDDVRDLAAAIGDRRWRDKTDKSQYKNEDRDEFRKLFHWCCAAGFPNEISVKIFLTVAGK